MSAVSSVSQQIKEVAESGVQLAIVCGGGNILRGKQFSAVSEAIYPATAHYMGMLATCINGLALQDALENVGVPTRLQTAIRMEGVAEPFIRRRCVRHLEKGRATPGLVDSLKVDVYGSPTPIKQIANVSVPEPSQIVIRPFDRNLLNEIAKTIQASNLGLSPNNEGALIRLNIPPLSTERRKQLGGRVKELAEEARISIRNIRRDANKHADTSQKDKILSEDQRDDVKDKVQELTKKHEGVVTDTAAAKEKDIMES
ncbi:UNVERIFIED_CONTAM: hypothetical protein GTU68_010686 [Idotea baltica]|nr:hypothetical protein [Idotea baltica]